MAPASVSHTDPRDLAFDTVCLLGGSLSVRSRSWAAVVNICVVSFNDASNAIQGLPAVGVVEVLLAAEPHDSGLLLAAVRV